MNVRDLYTAGMGVRRLVETELETPSYSQSLAERLSLWRRGFLSRSGVLYDLEGAGAENFVTDYERFVRTKLINGTWSVALSNKLFFDWLMRSYDDHRMAIYGLVRDGRVHVLEGESGNRPSPDGGALDPETVVDRRTSETEVHDAGEWVADRLDREGKLVLKWVRGGGGNNVLLCARTDDGYAVNGEHHTRRALEARIDDLEDYLVCEHVEQGPYSAAFYPETPNTLRLVTMYDDEAEGAFVGAAIQRIGSDAAGAMDNFSKGGLNAEIDIETGELGPGVQLPDGDRHLEWHARHPDTGAQVEGVRVPGWESIRERICEIASELPVVPYVGWDLVVTDEAGGFTVIEANSNPGLKSIQVHGPLLTDERVRRFYERRDVR